MCARKQPQHLVLLVVVHVHLDVVHVIVLFLAL